MVDTRLDERCFEILLVGPRGKPEYMGSNSSGRSYRLGASRERWSNASRRTFQYEIARHCDLLFARTDEEWRWVPAFATMMKGIYRSEIRFREIGDVYGANVGLYGDNSR